MNYAMCAVKTMLVHFVRRYRVEGDINKVHFQMAIAVVPVPGRTEHYISIEERER